MDDARLYEAGISSGINFNKYSHIPCKVTGENPPHAIETFTDSGERWAVFISLKLKPLFELAKVAIDRQFLP